MRRLRGYQQGAVIACCALLLVSCGKTGGARPQPPREWPNQQPQAGSLDSSPNSLAPVQYAASASAFRLLNRMAQEHAGSLVFSPAQAVLATGILHDAAPPEVSARLRALIGLKDVKEADVRANAAVLYRILRQPGRGASSLVDTACWLPPNSDSYSTFSNNVRATYRATVMAVDSGTLGGQDQIKRWFGAASRRPGIALPDLPGGRSLLLATSALLHAPWTQPFDVRASAERPFVHASGRAEPRTFMTGRLVVQHSQVSGADRLDLSLGEGQVSLAVLLPRPGRSVDQVLHSLSPEEWAAASQRSQVALIDLALPRLQHLDALRLDRLPELKGLDVSRAVDGPLALGRYWQLVPWTMDENGINDVGHPPAVLSTRPPGDPTATYSADRPFAFIVTTARGTLPLYAGVVR